MNHIIHRLTTASAAIAACTVLFAACSSDTTGPGNNTGDQTVAPKVGSTYTYSQQNQNEDGAPVGSPATRTDTLFATGLTVDGKSDVYGFYNGRDTMYYRYEANGDIAVNVRTNYLKHAGSEWRAFPLTNAWITIPFGSKGVKNDTLAKVQNYGSGSVQVPLLIAAESMHAGTESVTVGAESLTAQKAETTVRVMIGSLLHKVEIKWSMIPKIGYFSRHDFIINPVELFGSSGITRGGSVSTLTSYSLK